MSSEKINSCLSIVWEVCLAEITSVQTVFCFEPYQPQTLLAMFALQRISSDSSPNRYTFLALPGSPRSRTSSGLQCHCCSSSPSCYHILIVFLLLLMLTTLNSSSLLSTRTSRLAPPLAELTSAVGCLPATSISTVFFLLQQFVPFQEALSFTDKHHAYFCPDYQESQCEVTHNATATTFFSFSRCPNSSRCLSVLQLPPGWAPNRPLSSLYNSYRRLQPVSFSSTLNSFISSPSHWPLWLLILNSKPQLSSPCAPSGAMTFPTLTGLHTDTPYLQVPTRNSVLPKQFMSTFPPIYSVYTDLHLLMLKPIHT